MRKSIYFAQIVAISLFVLWGCAKEAQVSPVEEPMPQTEVMEGHYMTLSLNLPAETKMTHELDGPTMKNKWEVGDCIRVYNRDANNNNDGFWTILHAEDIADEGKSATFTSTNTTVTKSTAINIYYHSNYKGKTSESQLGSNLNFSSQNGNIESLPEYLSAINVKIQNGGIALSPSLTRFHFHFDQSTNPGIVVEDGTFSSVTLKKVWGSAVLGNQFNLIHGGGTTDYTEGEITVTPSTPFEVSKDGEWSIDFYIAAYISQSTDALFCITFNPSDPSGISYEYNWYPTKTYATTKVYKASPKFNGFIVPKGKRLTLNYTTENASPAGYYSYWRMLMFNGTEVSYFSDLRCDYWNNISGRDYMFSTDNFTKYHTILNGGTTVTTIDNSDHGYVYVQSTSSHSGTTEVYSQTYAHAASSYVRIKLIPDGSTITMNSASMVSIPTDEDVVSVSSSFTSKYEGVAGKICLNPDLIPVTATYADSHTSSVSDGIGQYKIQPLDGVIDYNGNAVIHFRGDNALTGNINTASASSVLSAAVLSEGIGATHDGEDPAWHFSVDTNKWTVGANSSQTVGYNVAVNSVKWLGMCPGVEIYTSEDVCIGDVLLTGNSWNYMSNLLDDAIITHDWADDTARDNGIEEFMDGGTVYVSVSNSGEGKASVRFYVKKGDAYHYQYFDNLNVPEGNIKFALTTDNCHLSF